MGAFGDRLRREREMRGISLEEIVATTKIGTRLLRALENEQFEQLPGGIFNKSYVRAYAKCVGIDEDEAVAAYLEATTEKPPDTRVIAHQHSTMHFDRPVRREGGFPVVPVLILLVVVAGGMGGWKLYQDKQRDREILKSAAAAEAGSQNQSPAATSPASAPSASSTPAAQPVNPTNTSQTSNPPASSSASSAAPTEVPKTASEKPSVTPAAAAETKTTGNGAAEGTPFDVVIRPKDPAWVSVKSDGQFVVRGIIRPPDVKTIHATDQVVFWTGNSGAVEVSFNGKDVPLPGGLNQEGVLVFNSHGVVQRPAAAR